MNTKKITVKFAETNNAIKVKFGVLHNVGGEPTIPEGYIKPEGVANITANGTHDVTKYAQAVVAVNGRDIVGVSIREV